LLSFDELAARLHQIAHQRGDDAVGRLHLLDLDLEQVALLGIIVVSGFQLEDLGDERDQRVVASSDETLHDFVRERRQSKLHTERGETLGCFDGHAAPP
jgi:hypothetical protein